MRKRATAAIAALATMLLGTGLVLASHQFPDVPTSHTFHDEIDWLVDNGITTGYANGNFGPQDSVTRGQMAAFLQRYYDNVGQEPGLKVRLAPLARLVPQARLAPLVRMVPKVPLVLPAVPPVPQVPQARLAPMARLARLALMARSVPPAPRAA